MTRADLNAISVRCRDWLTDACFPLWAERGAHPAGGFRERLSLDGTPIDDPTSRVRVQARQTYLFSLALTMGWEPATSKALIARGVESMLGPCRRDDKLFGRILRPGDGLEDDTADLYDNAFCLFALAWAAKATNDSALIDEGDATLAAIRAQMTRPTGGFAEAVPPRLPRRQNPHMHLCEAALALNEASGRQDHLDLAGAMAGLFWGRFIDADSGRLVEFFAEDWTAEDGRTVDAIEPGHEFEWTWILSRLAKAGGGEFPAGAAKVYANAVACVDENGFTPQVVSKTNVVQDATRRTWQQTEAVRAHLAMAEAGDEAAKARIAGSIDLLFSVFLDPAPAGGWRDHYEADGKMIAADMPASTGYHVAGALAAALEVLPGLGS